jgi:hypothetical protein
MIAPVSLLAAHAAHAPAGRPFGALAFSVAFRVIGALLVFDVAGLATQVREQNRDIAPWGRWVREHWDPPDAPTFVGWIFFLFGAFSTIYFLFKVVAPGTPIAELVTIVLCAVLGVLGLWLVPELWRGPSGRRPHRAQGSRLVRIRFAAVKWLDGDPLQQHRARGFVPVLAFWWSGLIAIVLGAVLGHLDGDAALAVTVLIDAFGAAAVISILFMMTAIADVWPPFVVPPRLRHPTRLPDLR